MEPDTKKPGVGSNFQVRLREVANFDERGVGRIARTGDPDGTGANFAGARAMACPVVAPPTATFEPAFAKASAGSLRPRSARRRLVDAPGLEPGTPSV